VCERERDHEGEWVCMQVVELLHVFVRARVPISKFRHVDQTVGAATDVDEGAKGHN